MEIPDNPEFIVTYLAGLIIPGEVMLLQRASGYAWRMAEFWRLDGLFGKQPRSSSALLRDLCSPIGGGGVFSLYTCRNLSL